MSSRLFSHRKVKHIGEPGEMFNQDGSSHQLNINQEYGSVRVCFSTPAFCCGTNKITGTMYQACLLPLHL